MRFVFPALAGLGVTLLVGGCARGVPVNAATLSSGTAAGDACRGMAFDADAADPRCLHHGVIEHTPPASALRVGFASAPVARSGYDAGLVLQMQNATDEPLLLDVDDACGTFEAQASNAAANSFESDCFGACGRGPEPHVLRVTLEPGGVIRKRVKFFAVQTRLVADDREECVTRTIGGLPPGAYSLQVTLPWTDAIPGDPAVSRPRVIEAPLTVTP
jgi:hypothetical protein